MASKADAPVNPKSSAALFEALSKAALANPSLSPGQRCQNHTALWDCVDIRSGHG
jgi:hypothetical protein